MCMSVNYWVLPIPAKMQKKCCQHYADGIAVGTAHANWTNQCYMVDTVPTALPSGKSLHCIAVGIDPCECHVSPYVPTALPSA